MAEFPDHEVLVIRDMTYTDCSGIRAVDLKSITLVGPDCSGCFEQDLKMYLLDASLGMGKKLLDESISDSFPSVVFPHVDREDVTPVLRPKSWRHVEARESDQISAPEGPKNRSAEPMPIGSQHGLSAFVLFGRTKCLRVRLKRLRANVAKDLEIVDSQSADFQVRRDTRRVRHHGRLLSSSLRRSAGPLVRHIPPRPHRVVASSLSLAIARSGAMLSISPRVRPISISSLSLRSCKAICGPCRQRQSWSARQYCASKPGMLHVDTSSTGSPSASDVMFVCWGGIGRSCCCAGREAWPNKRPRPMPAGPGEKMSSSNS